MKRARAKADHEPRHDHAQSYGRLLASVPRTAEKMFKPMKPAAIMPNPPPMRMLATRRAGLSVNDFGDRHRKSDGLVRLLDGILRRLRYVTGHVRGVSQQLREFGRNLCQER